MFDGLPYTEIGEYIDLSASIPVPPIGGKCWVLDRKGKFILERGPGTLRTIACAHAGSGSLHMLDGLPDEFGHLSLAGTDIPGYIGNGRQLYKANPVVMGSWMMDGGFQHGLTVHNLGGDHVASPIATIIWMPFRKR